MATDSNLVTVGRITTVHGVKGWVKVHSSTSPPENILHYQPWWLKTRHGVKSVEIDSSSNTGKVLLAHIAGVDDRDQAQQYCQVDIAVERNLFPDLSRPQGQEQEYYWYQLEGLRVITSTESGEQVLGTVQKLIETGANDVLVVKGDEQSVDQRERLIPWVPGQFVGEVDLEQKTIQVHWDPEF